MNYNYLQKYLKNFPITSFIIGINGVIFLLNTLGIAPTIISTPGILSFQTVLANFFHANLIHFAFNMLIVWQISPLIEVKFRGIYYAGILLSFLSLVSLGVARLSHYPTLGFSGIGLGIMVFAGLIYWKNKHISKQLIGWAAANIIFGLMPGISFIGHAVGAFAGLLVFGIIYMSAPQLVK